jgi:hypothetical protein
VALVAGQALFGLNTEKGQVQEVVAASSEAEEAAAVVEAFYRWYVDYPGNPIVERAYRQSPLLSEALVTEIDETIEAMNAAGPGGADPVLCAQDIPGELRYSPAVVSGETATVVVQQVWNPGTESESIRELQVEAQQAEGEWLISDITCPAP